MNVADLEGPVLPAVRTEPVREQPRLPPSPAECRTLELVPDYEWASEPPRSRLEDIRRKAAKHAGVVSLIDRDADNVASQDLATAKLPNPLAKFQGRLRIAQAHLEFHESLLPYLHELVTDANARYLAEAEKVGHVKKLIDGGLEGLGFAPGLDPRIYTRNLTLNDAKNAAQFASYDKDQILQARRTCEERIKAAKGEISYVESQIRSALK